MLMFKGVKTAKNEQGFASVVVALTLIIVLALLTVAFAQLARREQQNALDKQLSIQAYYAAESGVNDIVSHLKTFAYNTNPNQCLDTPTLNNAITGNPSPAQDVNNVNNNNGVSYSCVLLNKLQKFVQIDGISNNQGQYSTLTANGPTISAVRVEWTSGDNQRSFPNSTFTKFPPQYPSSNWNGLGYPAVVQFSLTPSSNLTRSALINNSFTAYLYPASTGANTVNDLPSNNGQIVSGKCSTAYAYNCKVTINNLNDTQFIFHFATYYDANTNIKVTPLDSSGNPIQVLDQATIDVTGKARNVVKRIRVIVKTNKDGSAKPTSIVPDYALEAQNICKRIWAAPVTTENPAGSQYKYPGSAPSPDPCNLSN